MAHYAKTEVLSIDYRMPPDFPFPAAIDDSVAVLERSEQVAHAQKCRLVWLLDRWRNDPSNCNPV